MKGSIDNGEIIAETQGNSISFIVPARATYARVTASKGAITDDVHKNDSHEGEQWAWTQPFWVSLDGIARSQDPRHRDTSSSLSAWAKMPDKKRLVLELYDEQAASILRKRSTHQTPR